MKSRGCLIAVAVAFAAIAIFAALLGPTIVREGRRLYQPLAQMKEAQTEFEAWSDEHRFTPPPLPALTAEQLDRFLDLRRRLAGVDEANPLPVDRMRRNQRPALSDIEGMLEGVGGAVTGRMEAYREAGMTPDEYRYLERVVYQLWLRPLRTKGVDPAAVARGSREILDLASSEKDAAIASRLRSLARSMVERRVDAPAGVSPELHALLLSRAAEIDALLDAGSSMPMRGRNPRPDF